MGARQSGSGRCRALRGASACLLGMPADRGRTGADGPGAADAAFVVGAAALAGRDASPCPGCCQPRPVIARGLTRPPCDFIVELVIAKLGVGGSVGDLMLSAAGPRAPPLGERALL